MQALQGGAEIPKLSFLRGIQVYREAGKYMPLQPQTKGPAPCGAQSEGPREEDKREQRSWQCSEEGEEASAQKRGLGKGAQNF